MATFAWQVFASLFAPHSVCFFVAQFPGQPPVAIGGIWDTGATVTTLITGVEQGRLGIPDNQCIPMGLVGASGDKIWDKMAVIDATLDGHTFRMPIAFGDSMPINVVGRVGFADQWEIRSDPSALSTTFEWRGPGPAVNNQPWTALWETYWQAMLKLGYNWTNWNANGRPDVPMPPSLPTSLPQA